MSHYALRAFLLVLIMNVCCVQVLGAATPAPATGTIGATTGASTLSAADIARMSAEASAEGARFSNQTLGQQVKGAASVAVKVVENPFTTLFSLMIPLGMFAVDFFAQAVESVKSTDYMGSTMSVLVNPAVAWNNFLASEAKAVNKIIAPATKTGGITVPTVKQLQATDWQTTFTGNVGITYDFGFAAAGDDLTQPFGFLRSATTGKYYYRPVVGQMSPATMNIQGKSYPVSFQQKPFNVLVPYLLTSLEGAGSSLWSSIQGNTQLDPVKIFMLKTSLLVTSAMRNSLVVTTTTKSSVTFSEQGVEAKSFSYSGPRFSYVSDAAGANYPGIMDIHTEMAKLLQRLKITPDISRTVAANGGQTMPSLWDPAKIVYMGDINPGLLLLSVLPAPIKAALNAMFKVKVSFYEFQKAIDITSLTAPTAVQLMYDHVCSLGSDETQINAAKAAAAPGTYVDGYILQLASAQQFINPSGHAQPVKAVNFTDVMIQFFLLRRLLAQVFENAEFIVTTDGGVSAASALLSGSTSDTSVASAVGADSSASSAATSSDTGLTDSSVDLNARLADLGDKTIDYDLLMNSVLPARVAALKTFAASVQQYVSAFIANNTGGSLVDSHYLYSTAGSSSVNANVAKGGADDLATYFPPTAMKQTLSEFVGAVGAQARAIVSSIDGQVASLTTLAAAAQHATKAYQASVASLGAGIPSLLTAQVKAVDALITAMRAQQSSLEQYSLYPVGYPANLLKIVQLPGAVYLAYSLNYLMGLLSAPFEGDALYYYDDSYLDPTASYLRLVAILFRARSDLSKAGAVVSATKGPVSFTMTTTNASGNHVKTSVVVPSGSQYYSQNLQEYDQYMLLEEQAMRAAASKYGTSSTQYTVAATAYKNACTLLTQKKQAMNTLLRTFEFDRRQGIHQSPVLPIASASTLTLTTTPTVQANGLNSGIAGTLADGTVVYTYERTVNGFLEEELARLAFRTNMIDLTDLQELVYNITGIHAQDLWAGVEARKQQLLADQESALAAVASFTTTVSAIGTVLTEGPGAQAALNQLLATAGLSGAGAAASSASSDPAVDSSVGTDAGSYSASTGSISSAAGSSVSVAPLVLTPVPVVNLPANSGAVTSIASSGSSVASVGVSSSGVASPSAVSLGSSAASGSAAAPVLANSDLDSVVANAQINGQTSYNDSSGQQALSATLSGAASAFTAAGTSGSGADFTTALEGLVGVIAGALNPSSTVQATFVTALKQAISQLALTAGGAGVSDVNAAENMLLVVTYLQNGILATQSSQLSVMANQLGSSLHLN